MTEMRMLRGPLTRHRHWIDIHPGRPSLILQRRSRHAQCEGHVRTVLAEARGTVRGSRARTFPARAKTVAAGDEWVQFLFFETTFHSIVRLLYPVSLVTLSRGIAHIKRRSGQETPNRCVRGLKSLLLALPREAVTGATTLDPVRASRPSCQQFLFVDRGTAMRSHFEMILSLALQSWQTECITIHVSSARFHAILFVFILCDVSTRFLMCMVLLGTREEFSARPAGLPRAPVITQWRIGRNVARERALLREARQPHFPNGVVAEPVRASRTFSMSVSTFSVFLSVPCLLYPTE